MTERQEPVTEKEKIELLVGEAVKAPSSHNTQPWLFHRSVGSVRLLADRSRSLPRNDPEGRELVISCGCALMNIRVAAAHQGIGIRMEEISDDQVLAELRFTDSESVSGTYARLFPAIQKRRTFRKPFQEKEIPDSVVGDLVQAAEREGAWLSVLPPGPDREKAAGLVARGDMLQWSDKAWRSELAQWMKPKKRGEGLAVPAFMVPVARTVVGGFDMGKVVGKKDSALAAQSPVVAVLGTDRDELSDWLHAGQALERVLLRTCLHGLQASYLNQPVQIESLRPKLQQLLPRSGFPQIVLRFGFPPKELPPAPRRSVDEVIMDSGRQR
jgi:hypothetical protein